MAIEGLVMKARMIVEDGVLTMVLLKPEGIEPMAINQVSRTWTVSVTGDEIVLRPVEDVAARAGVRRLGEIGYVGK